MFKNISASVMVRKFVHEDIVILIMQSVTTFGSSENFYVLSIQIPLQHLHTNLYYSTGYLE